MGSIAKTMNIQLKLWAGIEALGTSPDMPCIMQKSQEEEDTKTQARLNEFWNQERVTPQN